MQDVALIVNPVAGRGKTVSSLDRIERMAREAGLNYTILKTSYPGEATLLARKAAEEGARVVAAVGGDGTVSEVGAGLVRTDAALAVIATGTGNDFARLIGVRRNLPLCVRTLRDGAERRIDVGRAGDRYFLNTLGIGFDGRVTYENRKIKTIRGMASYMVAVLRLLPTYRNPTFHLKTRDWEYSSKGVLIEVGNGSFAGGGFKLCPGADPHDGILDITFLGDYRPMQRWVALPMVLMRQHQRLRRCRLFRCDLFKVSVSRPIYMHLDGNLHYLREPMTVEVLPAALKVLFPPGSAAPPVAIPPPEEPPGEAAV
ncbi:MAG: diacylglycerol kinase family lipid kinase [Acidobacteriota bacterium]